MIKLIAGAIAYIYIVIIYIAETWPYFTQDNHYLVNTTILVGMCLLALIPLWAMHLLEKDN